LRWRDVDFAASTMRVRTRNANACLVACRELTEAE